MKNYFGYTKTQNLTYCRDKGSYRTETHSIYTKQKVDGVVYMLWCYIYDRLRDIAIASTCPCSQLAPVSPLLLYGSFLVL